VSHVDASVLHHRLHCRREFEQPQQVGDTCPRPSDRLRDLVVRELEFLDEALQAAGFFNGVQVLALDVLYEADAERRLVRDFAHDRRNALEARQACSAPAACARKDLVMPAVDRTHDDGLDDASRAHRIGELRERGLVHSRSRLVAPRPKRRDRDLAHRILVLRVAIVSAQQRIESAPKPLVACRHAASATLMPLRASSARAN
jgi:hypothetical protein